MHDPDTQAFVIRYPWWHKETMFKTGRYHNPFITVWHHDPERGGSDDSCGWFKRARHGDKAVLERIIKRFEYDWDRVFKSDSGKTYFCGFFFPEDCDSGINHLSVLGVGMNLFFLAALEHFGSRRRAIRFIQKHLFEILLFSENPFDSLHDAITRKFGYDTKREERIHSMAACIYGWILRETQPWYRHPRWHIHHWRLQIHPWQTLRRGLFDRCSKCHKGFRFGESVIGDWGGTTIWHDRCDNSGKPAPTPK